MFSRRQLRPRARRSVWLRWLMSWPAIDSTMVQRVMVPRSG